MGGGLMQLVAYGAQDIYITGNPQITFFKIVYRRHTNFAMETVQQSLTGTNVSSLTSKKECSSIISRNGDLITNLYVTSSTPGIVNGDAIIDDCMIEIGGQKIDKHYKEWMQIWAELTTPESKALAYKNMTGSFSHSLNKTDLTSSVGANLIQIPILFWFCRNPGLALPLIALQYHEVKIKITLGKSDEIGTSTLECDAEIKLFVDYIYLDTDERRRFAQVSHEYLIEQLQRVESTNDVKHNLNLNHPVKEIIWTSPIANSYGNAKIQLNGHDRITEQEEEYFQLRQPYDYHTAVPGTNMNIQEHSQIVNFDNDINKELKKITGFETTVQASNDAVAVLSNFNLKFNTNIKIQLKIGDVILATMTATTKTISQLITITGGSGVDYTFNNNITDSYLDFDDSGAIGSLRLISRLQNPISRCSNLNKKINVYSFALQPEEHQPSGTCNFSRIDNAKLILGSTPGDGINIYATNYNVLRIMSGMGGLAYSN
tara:strand:+ start:2078 stop:3541 length:1464 start_codon:yes stop_codon:yes gene_type:complete